MALCRLNSRIIQSEDLNKTIGAMETPGHNAALSYFVDDDEEERVGYYELEHLPPLLEDEENVSLADILSLQDSCLSDEDVWAVCVECVLSLQSIESSALFHSLCITPDTLAFNAHGNVCFMEQLSDDPEGSFVPPEFDSTGSTFEGHVYSLGSTLAAALDFVMEPELEAELAEETQRLLEQMQEDRPEDRPRPQHILALAGPRLSHTSSADVCRRLSSVGRRVLSIESVATIQDGQGGSWEARWQHSSSSAQLHRPSSAQGARDAGPDSAASAPRRQQLYRGWGDGWDEGVDGGVDTSGGETLIPSSQMDCRSQNSSPVRRRAQQRSARVRGALNRSCSVPDSNNPPSLSPEMEGGRGDISVPVSDLTEIGDADHWDSKSMWTNRLKRLNRGYSCDSHEHAEGCVNSVLSHQAPGGGPFVRRERTEACVHGSVAQVCGQESLFSHTSCRDPEMGRDSAGDQNSLGQSLYSPNNHMTKSMLCLNEESQDEWISLRELLTRCGRRLTVNELWALCYTCLSTLQTYIDFPAYLCLDTAYVGCEGEVLFLKPKTIGSCDAFYLAPEYQEHGIMTEKACVYGVAAILWATAKFCLSPNQKLAMPRRLKRLLLEMAKRTPIERPSIVVAKKSCRDYLSRQGTTAESVWIKLINRFHQPHSKPTDVKCHNALEPDTSLFGGSAHVNSGFVPMATESRLAPIPGPVPHSYSAREQLQLPEAFTSAATHFTPIILTQQGDSEGKVPSPGAVIERTVGESTERISERDHVQGKHCQASAPSKNPPLAGTETNAHTHTGERTSGVSLSPPPHNNGCGVFNNYLLHFDPGQGRLTLVPVQATALDSELKKPLLERSVQEHASVSEVTKHMLLSPPSVGVSPCEHRECTPPPLRFSGSSHMHRHTRPFEDSVPETLRGEAGLKSQGVDQFTSGSSGSPDGAINIQLALHVVIDLLKYYMEKRREDLAIGEYLIFSLKALHYQTFASVVKQTFFDLHWEEDLLGLMHCLVSHSPAPLGSNEQPASNSVQRASAGPPLRASVWGEPIEARPHSGLHLNGSTRMCSRAAGHTRDPVQASLRDTLNADSEERLHCVCEGLSSVREGPDTGLMEGGGHAVGGSDESASEAESLWGREESSEGGCEDQMSPDCSEDMEDSDSVASERLPLSAMGAEAAGLSCRTTWATAFYGDACFSRGVVEYALSLGQHSGSPCLDVKTQELQQQLLIESRNLKKTKNFYQKLTQLERKRKGAENKMMLSKLKSQLDELRSKVEFLDSVKKYLEMLTVDQWGIEVSLLPSLAACGSGSLELRSFDEAAVLSFGSSKGKTTLQAGSPHGLLAYLYTRSAALEGYIQQFLYTYRYFCSCEQFLHFLMDRFISAVRGGPDMSGNKEKVFHRSLDLIQAWLTDCRLVDLTSGSSLFATLETFLVAEVAPVDSRGAVILSFLHSPPQKRASESHWSSKGFDQGGDSLSVHSSVEDPGRKFFQWRISRVVEPSSTLPKEKAFSIAAALPVPCYSSLVEGFSAISVCREESLPFSKREHSAQHIAQQLTLLQQEMFHGCHPVHFLNSRTQGVRDQVLSINKNVHQLVPPPAEGSSLFVCEGSPSDSYLPKLLAYADSVTNWVSAEIVTCDSVKTQVALLTKFLLVGKCCYEARNFATAMQILRGLENVIVRQLPAWKHLSTKVCEILEELRAVQVFLKSDDLCLMGGEQARRQPTLPACHILAMHIQQLEIGAFTLTNGAYKWAKLRSIAKVVSQVQAFQEVVYPYSPDREVQVYLKLRIGHFSGCDVHLLAAGNQANFQPSTERHTQRIQDTLRRVKASFQ